MLLPTELSILPNPTSHPFHPAQTSPSLPDPVLTLLQSITTCSPSFLSLMSPPADILGTCGSQLFAAGWKQEASLSSVRVDANQSQQGTGPTNSERALCNWRESQIHPHPATDWRVGVCQELCLCCGALAAAAWGLGLGVQSPPSAGGLCPSPSRP